MVQKKYKLGFIGCGHMGMSIVHGALNSGMLKADEMTVYDPNPSVQNACASLGIACQSSEADTASGASMVLLAVTPQRIDDVLDKIAGSSIECILTIAAAVTIGHIQSKLSSVPVIRVMPNTPLMVSCGATALCHSSDASSKQLEFVRKLFSSLGIVVDLPEDQMDIVISANGSTPAYFYYFLNSILKDLVKRGMDAGTARALLIQTMIGSGKLLENDPERPLDDFIRSVCSKGGTTIEAIQVYEKRDLDRITAEANEACIKRAEELKK